VDRVLFKNLVEMVPLVESLMVSNSFRVPRADLAGGAGCWDFRAPAGLVSMRCLTAVLCWFFYLVGAGPEGQPGLLAPRFAGLHAGAA